MKSATTERFRKAFEKLPVKVKERAKAAYQLWKSDAEHASLQFKQIHQTKPVYSVRIGLSYRALGILDKETMIWFWIGSHEDYNNLIKRIKMQEINTYNRIDQVFEQKKENILSVYYTAGFPALNDTVRIAEYLEKAGADFIEIGMPFSDPLADGPTIQDSSMQALQNGMSLKLLFEQLRDVRQSVSIPMILMGYMNPVMQFGVENFCKHCQAVGVDALILPDLPMQEYLNEYKDLFEAYGLYNIFLITPQTSEARIHLIDEHSHGFIYMVSSASITGAKSGITEEQITYFKRVKAMNLKNPTLIGFGISNYETFSMACSYANGAIIGSAFIKALKESNNLEQDVMQFIASVKGKNS